MNIDPNFKIECQHITHVFRTTTNQDTVALQNVSLGVRDCEFLCLLGPSGCGKTTLLRVIAGLLEPDDGVVLLDNVPSVGPHPDKGMVFQRDATFPWLTVAQNVEYGLKLRGLGRKERAEIVDKYIHLVGLAGFEHAFPKELSGGMRKRVDIARTYAYNPKVLLMDEPFGSLDLFTKTRMQAEAAAIVEPGTEDRGVRYPRPRRGDLPVGPRGGDEPAAGAHS